MSEAQLTINPPGTELKLVTVVTIHNITKTLPLSTQKVRPSASLLCTTKFEKQFIVRNIWQTCLQ
jgi:hypothetical protein